MWIGIMAAVAAASSAAAAWYAAATRHSVIEVHAMINSRMDQLLEVTRVAAQLLERTEHAQHRSADA